MKKEEAYSYARQKAKEYVNGKGNDVADQLTDAFVAGFMEYHRKFNDEMACRKRIKYCMDDDFRQRTLDNNFRSREKKFRLV